MAKGRKTKAGSSAAVKLASIAAFVAVVVVGYYVSTRGDGNPGPGPHEYVPVSTFSDVHGLAASPTEADVVFVATHHGLMRVQNTSIARVGTMQDDLMGFTMHPTEADTFWTSGHPRSGGNMGVRLSTDGGFTWETIWDEKVDFHAMTTSPVNPRHLWGYYAGKLYESLEAGKDWRVADGSPPQMRGLAADPRRESTLYATTSAGISRSVDAGRTWATMSTIPALGLAIDPSSPGVMYAGGRGAMWKSTDDGATFVPIPSPTDGALGHLSVSRADPGFVYAATYEAGLYWSNDSGATWQTTKSAG